MWLLLMIEGQPVEFEAEGKMTKTPRQSYEGRYE